MPGISKLASGSSTTGGTGAVQPQTGQAFLESALPGVTNLTTSATSVIGNLLNGLPSASQARTSNAYFGVGSGQPDSGGVNSFIANRGADLYNQQANQSRQQGLGDLNSLIGSVTAPQIAAQGQALQNQQFRQSQAQQGSEFDQNLALQQFQAELGALGLGNNIVGGLPGNISL